MRSAVISLAVGVEPQRNDLRVQESQENRAARIADTPAAATREVEPAGYVTAEPAAEPGFDKVAVPPLAINGYCVVELVTNGRWVKGDLRWTVVDKGRIYRFSGPAQRQQFLADPDAFTPVNSGNDPVMAVDENRSLPGQPAIAPCTTAGCTCSPAPPRRPGSTKTRSAMRPANEPPVEWTAVEPFSGDSTLMDPFRVCLALGPVAIYLLLLGAINLSRRPLLVSGACAMRRPWRWLFRAW